MENPQRLFFTSMDPKSSYGRRALLQAVITVEWVIRDILLVWSKYLELPSSFMEIKSKLCLVGSKKYYIHIECPQA
jgi:hypothetical protein